MIHKLSLSQWMHWYVNTLHSLCIWWTFFCCCSFALFVCNLLEKNAFMMDTWWLRPNQREVNSLDCCELTRVAKTNCFVIYIWTELRSQFLVIWFDEKHRRGKRVAALTNAIQFQLVQVTKSEYDKFGESLDVNEPRRCRQASVE